MCKQIFLSLLRNKNSLPFIVFFCCAYAGLYVSITRSTYKKRFVSRHFERNRNFDLQRISREFFREGSEKFSRSLNDAVSKKEERKYSLPISRTIKVYSQKYFPVSTNLLNQNINNRNKSCNETASLNKPVSESVSFVKEKLIYFPESFSIGGNGTWLKISKSNHKGVFLYAAYYDSNDVTDCVRFLAAIPREIDKFKVSCFYLEYTQNGYQLVGTSNGVGEKSDLRESIK